MHSKHDLVRHRSATAIVTVLAVLCFASAFAWFITTRPFAATAPGASAGGAWADPVRTDVNLSGRFLQNPDNKDPHDPDAIQRCGEPTITQDVLHPENLVVICMGVRGFNYQTPQPRVDWEFVDVTRSGSRAVSPVFVSRDAGSSWTRVLPDPLALAHIRTDRDPGAAYGPRGEMYLYGDAVASPVEGKHGTVVVTPGLSLDEQLGTGFTRSLDSGKTWSAPILIPTPTGPHTFAVDQSTGVLYHASTCTQITTIGPYGCTLLSRNLAVSRDQGRTWEPAVDIRNEEPPTTTRTPGRLHNIGSGAFAVGHGVFAMIKMPQRPIGVGYPPSPPEPGSVEQPVFRISTDEALTFTDRPLPIGNCRPQRIVADPTHRGGFAILAGCNTSSNHKEWWLASQSSLRVFVTRDMGVTWKQSAELAVPLPPGYVVDPADWKGSPTDAPPGTLMKAMPTLFFVGKTSIDFGITGALGVTWMQIYGPPPLPMPAGTNLLGYAPSRLPGPNGPRDIYLAISTDGGITFGKAIRLNSAASPPGDVREHDGDDFTSTLLDRNFAYTVWGDWRSGELQTWFRKTPLPGGG